MDDSLKLALVIIHGYLVGSIPMAYVIGRVVKGIDLRQHGSGNVGAANVWYTVGKPWIFPLGAFDLFVKGPTPVWIARHVMDLSVEAQVAAGLMAIVGHNWPIFLGFRGGRGIAPMVGVLLALARLELTLFIVVSVSGWRLTNSSALWVLISILLLPIWSLLLERPAAVVALMLSLIVITAVKRMTSNVSRNSSVKWPQLMVNRLLFDRDIADHDAWVRRRPAAPSG